MLKNLDTYLQDFITRRSTEIGNNVLLKHPKYQELTRASQNLLEEIIQLVPAERRSLVFEYEEKEHEQAALAIEIMYRQGVMDGACLIRSLLGLDSKNILNGGL